MCSSHPTISWNSRHFLGIVPWHVSKVLQNAGPSPKKGSGETRTTRHKKVTSLTANDACKHQLFNKLHCWLVTWPIFVRCQCLMARKIADLFSLNCGIWHFYAAHCFDELSKGSVLCLLNASFKTAVSQCHNLTFWAEIDDHGVRRSDTGQILAQWRHMVASRVALDLPYWTMRSASYRLIRMAIEMTSEGGAFVCHRRFYVLHNRS